MSTVLVVGGAGFVGSQVNKQLHEAGFKTVVFDNLSTGKRAQVTRGAFEEGDTRDSDALDRVFDKYNIDAVMHFAANIAVAESIENPAKYYNNNVAGTLSLLEAMLRHNVNKFVFSSSAAIFGLPETDLIAETHPQAPISPYGHSKLMIETILADFERAYGLKFCALRYFNAAGGDPDGEVKNRKTEECNLIPLILRSVLAGGTLRVNGNDYPTSDGTCVRDYVHIHDLGQAHIKGLKKLLAGEPSMQYNLGNGKGFSILEVIKAAEKVCGRTVTIETGPRRIGDPPILVASSSKAKEELGWEQAYPELETMITHAWEAMA